LRSYSLSNLSSPYAYRVSVKEEINGAASSYLRSQVRLGDVLDVSTPRGSFTLRPGKGPVVLLSAGIGATPVLAMLHALAAEGSARMIWSLFGARNSMEHPFGILSSIKDDGIRIRAAMNLKRRHTYWLGRS